MDDRSKSLLSQIKTRSKDLNDLADRASAYISEVEAELQNAGVGIEVWGPCIREYYTSRYDEKADESCRLWEGLYLGYTKIKGTWGLALSEEVYLPNENEPQEQEEWLLKSAPRSDRILAAPHIAELLAAISRELKAKAAQIEAALREDRVDDDKPEAGKTKTKEQPRTG